MNLAFILGLLLLVLPRVLFPPPPSRLRPKVVEFSLLALRLSVAHTILVQQYDIITLADYNQLSLGMTLPTVENHLGAGSEVRTQNLPGGAIATTYEWANPNGSRLVATFQDTKLTGKAQSGLR
ncbi:MAG: hypothetical protein AAGI69_16480 [Cyanobacteria bacterium P01_H01_bin.21]